MLTIVELPSYIKSIESVFDQDEREELKTFLSLNPEAGDLIKGTGGVRKLRWACSGRGKRGGARVIYFFHNNQVPLFLLAAYAKKDKENLSQDERNKLHKLIDVLVKNYE